MARVKRGTQKHKKRKRILSKTKGYRWSRKSKLKQARQAIFKAGSHAFAHRRKKKNDFRRHWTTVINYAVRPLGLTYSQFIHKLSEKEVTLNRKVLSEIAKDSPDTFKRIVEHVK